MKQYIPNPCASARYEIYRSCYLDLFRCGIISPLHGVATMDVDLPKVALFETESSGGDMSDMNAKYLPEYNILCLRHWNDESVPWRLWTIAEKSLVSKHRVLCYMFHIPCPSTYQGTQNLSGRTLCRLPVSALALHVRKDPCSIDEALVALAKAMKEEIKGSEIS